MEKWTVDALAQRLEKWERENRRWKYVAGVTGLVLTLSLTLGGLLGSHVVVAQQPEEKAGSPAFRPMEYKVTESMYLHKMEGPIQNTAAAGWEVVQIVPTVWTPAGQSVSEGIVVARRPLPPGK